MDLDLFLKHLHFHSERVLPPNWEVDWDDAPLPYKLYQDLPAFPLTHDLPLTGPSLNPNPDLSTLSCYLWYVYGLSQVCQTVLPSPTDGTSVKTVQSFRRFPPSGGALYPNELYVYLKIEELPDGVYHYDVAHHRLLLLREGNFDDYLTKALAYSSDLSECFGAVIVTSMFWKNFFKYHNFSYRLQGLDGGAVLGQLLEVSRRFGYSTCVHFQFLDQAIHHLLGLDDQEESSYAVVPLAVGKINRAVASVDQSSTELCKAIPAIKTEHVQRSQNVLRFPAISQINQRAMFDSSASFRKLTGRNKEEDKRTTVPLPEVKKMDDDFTETCLKRHSPEMDFISKPIDLSVFSSLLKETMESNTFDNDLGREEGLLPRVSVYGCFSNVEGVENGAYSYDASSHSLIRIQPGDFRSPLQEGMTLDNVNLHQVPLCLHIVGERNHYKSELGYRGYRIQHMEAGMLLQRLLLHASALGMNGHPLLGFDVNVCDQIYQLQVADQTTLIQIPVGYCRSKSWLLGRVHS